MSPRSIWLVLLVVSALGCERRATPEVPPPEPPSDALGAPADAPASTDAAPTEPGAATDAAPTEPGAPSDAAAPSGSTAPVDAAARRSDRPPAGKPDAGAPAKSERGCGGIAGFRCQEGEKCRYGKGRFAPGHPDAMGQCVSETYCDTPKDCEGLIHPMVVGAWACQRQSCAWKAEGAP